MDEALRRHLSTLGRRGGRKSGRRSRARGQAVPLTSYQGEVARLLYRGRIPDSGSPPQPGGVLPIVS